MDIVPVQTAAQVDEIRALFQEYWTDFGFTPCFQNFDAELAGLPGKYAPPRGRLAIALLDGRPAGCIALRPVDDARCEGKRLYVRPAFRGRGIGQALLDWLIAEARAAGYREMVGDTMPVMRSALSMYARSGFEITEPPAGDAIQLRLRLAD